MSDELKPCSVPGCGGECVPRICQIDNEDKQIFVCEECSFPLFDNLYVGRDVHNSLPRIGDGPGECTRNEDVNDLLHSAVQGTRAELIEYYLQSYTKNEFVAARWKYWILEHADYPRVDSMILCRDSDIPGISLDCTEYYNGASWTQYESQAQDYPTYDLAAAALTELLGTDEWEKKVD